MRIKNSMKNMIYIYTSTLLIAILNFVVRRVFLDVLTIDYLGYDGLFTSIFSLLSLSEMGIASIITYHMYSEIASDNTYEIRKLLYIYKTVYRVVGTFVLIAGVAVSFFIPFILKESQKESWLFIYTIYFLQLLATLCTYFFAYRRVLFITHQRIYVCTTVDTIGSIISVILKMIVLLVFKNYIVYLLIAIANNTITNLVIARLSRKEYPEITHMDITKEDIKKLNLLYEVKNMLATKVALTVYGGTDDIIITSILGITTSGLLSNYRMLSSKIQEMILSLFNSLQASIGNLVYDKESKNGKGFFKALDLLGFYMGLVCATGIVTVSQNFILNVWLKDAKYLLPFAFLVFLSINIYIAISNNPITYFRNSLGHFESDRNYMIVAAITNILISVILAFKIGITGVMIGTVAGHLIIFTGRIMVVHKFYIKENPVRYFIMTIGRLVLLFVSATLSLLCSKYLERFIGTGLVNVLVSGIFSIVISTLIFIVSSIKSEAFEVLIKYFRTVLNIILKRGKHE